jgi:hypothetical protein
VTVTEGTCSDTFSTTLATGLSSSPDRTKTARAMSSTQVRPRDPSMSSLMVSCAASTNRPHAPKLMNRQVGPSILLSVAIVCFFAVALYQPDPPQSPRAGTRSSSADAIARPKSALARGATRSESASADAADKARSAVAERPSNLDPMTPAVNPFSTNAQSRPVHYTSQRAKGLREPDAGTRGASPDAPRRPESAFTIVDENETLYDVALRVYGSSSLVDSLWRANRDTLSGRDSPLSTGMVLRTPVVQQR